MNEDIVDTLTAMADDTAQSWSDIPTPQTHEPGYEWYALDMREVQVMRAAAHEIRRLRATLVVRAAASTIGGGA